MAQAHVDFLKRCLVLMVSSQIATEDCLLITHAVRMAFQISCIQHAKVMVDTSSHQFVGLRTRRPPHLLQCSHSDPFLDGRCLLGCNFPRESLVNF